MRSLRPALKSSATQLVTTDEQGRKQVEYSGLIAPLIEAVKELDERLRRVEERGDTPGA